MTTKSKTTKTRKPAAKASAPKATAIEAKSTPREVSKIEALISHWHWLEADAIHQSDLATTEEESERLLGVPQKEQKKIESELAKLVPENLKAARCMLGFALNLMDGCIPNRDDIAMLENVHQFLRRSWKWCPSERSAA